MCLKQKTLNKQTTHHTPQQRRHVACTQKIKMLASTIQFSHNTPTHPQLRINRNHQRCESTEQQCCPRHPTACQHTQATHGDHTFVYDGVSPMNNACPPGMPAMCPPGFKTDGSRTHAYSTTDTHQPVSTKY